MNEINADFDGFTIKIYLDEEGDWIAFFPELPNVFVFAETKEDVIKKLKVAWKKTKEIYRKHGEKIPIALSRTKLKKISLYNEEKNDDY